MCGRTACTLGPQELRTACAYKNKQGQRKKPQWRAAPGGKTYSTNYNVAPTSFMPILTSGHHFASKKSSQEQERDRKSRKDSKDEKERDRSRSRSPVKQEPADDVDVKTDVAQRVIQPMRWGLIPSFFKGEVSKFQYSTINARQDKLTSNNFFSHPLRKGQRCVVLADGYFEWEKVGKTRIPHFVYLPQREGADKRTLFLKREDSIKDEVKDEVKDKSGVKVKGEPAEEEEEMRGGAFERPEEGCGEEWTGRRPLMMAGLFDVWPGPQGEESEPLYSYTVITVDSAKDMGWLHDRMPAILRSDDEVTQWLDSGEVPSEKALTLLRSTEGLEHHRVSSAVGNVKNKTRECVVPYDESKEAKKGGSANLMASWLIKSSAKDTK